MSPVYLGLGPPCAECAVDHEVRDVDALRRQLAGHALCEARKANLPIAKARLRIALHARRCAGEKIAPCPFGSIAALPAAQPESRRRR